MRNNLHKIFSILLCITTLFMGVGYASINSISLDVNGEMIAQVQDGIFITEVNYNESLSSNVLATDSKINSVYQTNLDSSIVLNNESDSQITYDVTIYNSNDLTYVFDGVEYTLGTDTYDNENITFKLTNLSIGDVVNSKDDISFLITFYYKDSSNISSVSLDSILNFKFSIASYIVDTFEYTGNYETFTVPHNGVYQIELWGASGEIYELLYSETVGKGAYTSGNIYLEAGEKLYIYVGGATVFNGGAPGEAHGGGATDIRLVEGVWSNFDSLKSRIMVAAGGGGGVIKNWQGFIYTYEGDSPGDGGGLNGYDANYNVTNAMNPGYGYSGYGATQTSGGLPGKSSGYYELTEETKGHFGVGGYSNSYVEGLTIYNHSSGGGSGYYGGGHGVHTSNAWTGAGGGSSFISGHSGCDAILESSTETNIVHTGQSVHYSSYQFTNTIIIDGRGYNWTTEKGELVGMPIYDGTSSMLGNTGNGYVKITFISEK